MVKIKDSVAVINAGAIGFAPARHWVQNGDKVVLGDVAQEALV